MNSAYVPYGFLIFIDFFHYARLFLGCRHKIRGIALAIIIFAYTCVFSMAFRTIDAPGDPSLNRHDGGAKDSRKTRQRERRVLVLLADILVESQILVDGLRDLIEAVQKWSL